MPPGQDVKITKKHVSADVRREQLVAAALRVMKRDGIAAATTRAICAEAGMPHGAFHYCFRSKQELYAALLAADINTGLDGVWPVITPQADPTSTIRTLLRTFFSTVEADPETELVLTELIGFALREPELHGLPAWEHRAYLAKAVVHLERLADEAQLDYTIDIQLLAEMVVATLSGVTSSWLSHRDNRIAHESLDQFAVLFAGLTRPRQAG
ncbi:AcrR family transcriptional regulator [Kibdelosporangium banguiense]|uniref:AcrR family transcriptional regulator n=1 Tax=Kibdelosporangium banguiense TaxID=1365924 RepID=A0ABS4TUT1_9PSEU|nr:TetR/AcrR family transcriptional regulator [Kibdelosporangium banguiense]MBP2328162.1 AcrR family transcriptional regulator [Kibdelosporangium banguiense]